MGTTSRALYLIALLALAVLALKPHAPTERVLDTLVAPARLLGEVAWPMAWLRAREVRAAQDTLREREEQEFAARIALERDQRRFALPREPALRAGRGFVHAEVVGRVEGERDVALVRPPPAELARLRPGMPATAGDAFVGHVRALRPASGLVEVQMVTLHLVGARLVLDPGQDEAGAVRMVVGGLAPPRADGARPLELLVHNPSHRSLSRGQVVVDDQLSDAAPYPELSRGFRLGTLETLAEPGREPQLCVRPLLDYGNGLFEVVLVTPPQGESAPREPVDVLLEPGAWLPARALSSGDPAVWREGLELDAGTLRGVRVGAAVVFGARLVGRVRHVGPLSCDVALVGDPGFALPVLARVAGREEPLAMGRLVSLGRGGARDPLALRLRWEPDIGLLAGEGAEAELYSGSGDPLVPRGLYLGPARLPSGSGPHVIEVGQVVDVRALRDVWVRSAAAPGARATLETP